MAEKKPAPATVDAYIQDCSAELQPLLQRMRQTIVESGPVLTESISWGMPTFSCGKRKVHFAAQKKHIGFHPGPQCVEHFAEQLTDYDYSKGTVRFPYEKELPYTLIQEMVRYCMAQKPVKKTAQPRQRYEMPDELRQILVEHQLMEAYEARPPYQQNDYIGWIGRAKRAETKEKRIRQMLEDLASKQSYMGMPYQAKK